MQETTTAMMATSLSTYLLTNNNCGVVFSAVSTARQKGAPYGSSGVLFDAAKTTTTTKKIE